MSKCKAGYYYCYTDRKCKPISKGLKITARFGGGGREPEEVGIDKPLESDGNGDSNVNGGNGNGGGMSEGVMTKAQIKKRDEIADSMSTREFNKRYGKDRGKDVKYATATKLAMKETVDLTEKRDGKSAKDKGYSLRDWFKGGGWKQTGGKYDGKPCAKQPGQKTKPYCRDADDRAAMSKEERNKRAAKKRKEDPNPNRKGKAKNVTQESYSWREGLDEGILDFLNRNKKDASNVRKGTYHKDPKAKAGTIFSNLSKRNEMMRKLQSEGVKVHYLKDMDPYDKRRQIRQHAPGSPLPPPTPGIPDFYKKAKAKDSKKVQTAGFEPEGEMVEATYPSDFAKGSGVAKKKYGRPIQHDQPMKGPVRKTIDEGEKCAHTAKGKECSVHGVDACPDVVSEEGKKDACYHKVKSRYSVWPSAYASGALVKCRKVGAKNWGNKTKKESVDYSNWRDDFQPTEIETTDIIAADPIQVPPSRLEKIEEAKKCWKGYKKTGTQKLFGKTYNRCEKIKEGAAWTKKEGKNEKGGLNEKGRKSYEKENPGSDLKRPSKKVGNKRRASFCARMKGMKAKLTSKKTANDPDSRINKSLRAWNC